MITWRFAGSSDIDRFYGERPLDTMRAIVILIDDEPVSIIGLAYGTNRMLAFSEFRPALAPHLKSITVMRAVKAAQKMFAECKRPVVAKREECNGLLERLGFVQVDGEVYRWPS